jgi:uncharacterized protein involved in response to NO
MLFGFALAVVVGFLLTAGAAPCHCSASASSKASDGRPG